MIGYGVRIYINKTFEPDDTLNQWERGGGGAVVGVYLPDRINMSLFFCI